MDDRSLKKCFIQLFLSKLSRDSDSGGYGVTLLGTKTSSCEGLRIFEESLVISFLCSSHVQKCRTSCVQFSAIHFIRTCSYGMGKYSCS